MSIVCPYCLSDQVVQVVNTEPYGNAGSQSLAASASFATIGASISKNLPTPISPLIGGIAGALIGGLFGRVMDEPRKQIPMRYYHCNTCQQNFQ